MGIRVSGVPGRSRRGRRDCIYFASDMDTLLVTGGAGFIGSNFVRLALFETADKIVVLDKLTYAGNRESLAGLDGPRLTFIESDIADRATVRRLFAEHRPRAVVNFAAESHVDRSIEDASAFV